MILLFIYFFYISQWLLVAGEVEALPEAAWPYPKGVGDFDIPAVGGTVSQEGRSRDSGDPPGNTMAYGLHSRHSSQEHERNTSGNY